jgi:hypothetical protein
MNRKAMSRLTFAAAVALALSVSMAAAGHGGSESPPGLVNIALGKPYAFGSPPNYGLCTDADDTTQLTDGAYTKGLFWGEKSTVGWGGQRVMVTIDLGTVQPICGASYNTAAGAAEVLWPELILVMVSDDGKTYYVAGDLVALSAEHGEPPAEAHYAVHRFWTDQLATRGRFVKFVVEKRGPYTFVDEIEVYRGNDALVGQPRIGRKGEDTTELHKEAVMTLHVRKRLGDDLKAVRESLKNEAGKEALERELAGIEKMIPGVQAPPLEGFRAVLPLNDLHKRIFAVQASVWRANGVKPLAVWQKNYWDMLSPTEPPLSGGAKVDVVMMKNEWRSAAFNLSNAGSSPTTLQLSIIGLPGGRNPKCVSVRDVPFTDTKSGVPVAAALPEAKSNGANYLFQIESGMTRQVWLTFNSKGIPAGEYEGQVVAEPGAIHVPVRLKVCPITLPHQPALHLGGWDYTDANGMFDVTEQNRAALIEHLQEHFVDTPWASSSVMPNGKYNKDGTMIEPPDAKNFKTWIERWPNARNYFVFSCVGAQFAGFEMGTSPFKKAVASWITWWAGQLAKWNVEPEQLGLLLVDEPGTPEQDKVIAEYGRVIRGAQPKVIIWEDPIWLEPQKGSPEMFAAATILCSQLPMWVSQGKPYADFFVKQREAGRELWFYTCSGPGRLLDPYACHRMQPWFCWKYGAKGSCFWAFGDSSDASSWNEYISKSGAYTPLFLDARTVTEGKHMEAIREGMEDYEYLRMLRDRVVELQKKGAKGDAVVAAEALLASAAERVTACLKQPYDINWKEPKDRSIADRVRVEILTALLALEGQ